MGGKAKNKNQPAPTLKHGKNVFTVGTKFEAKDSMGNWYGSRVLKVDAAKKQVLIHFNGWSARYDEWLPPSSPRIRFPPPALKNKEKEWRIGDRTIAKWGPAARIYPATVSRLVNESQVEVTFYDGFKKVVSRSSLKPDTEKLYRQYESTTARKTIVSPKAAQKVDETNIQQATTSTGREKRKSHGPVTMADYVMTDIHAKRKRSKSDMETSQFKDLKSASITASKQSSAREKPESPIPKKSKIVEESKTTSATIVEKEKTNVKSIPEKLIDHCSIELSLHKNKTYVFFPKMEDGSDEAPVLPKNIKANSTLKTEKRNALKQKSSRAKSSKMKVKFPFGGDKAKHVIEKQKPVESKEVESLVIEAAELSGNIKVVESNEEIDDGNNQTPASSLFSQSEISKGCEISAEASMVNVGSENMNGSKHDLDLKSENTSTDFNVETKLTQKFQNESSETFTTSKPGVMEKVKTEIATVLHDKEFHTTDCNVPSLEKDSDGAPFPAYSKASENEEVMETTENSTLARTESETTETLQLSKSESEAVKMIMPESDENTTIREKPVKVSEEKPAIIEPKAEVKTSKRIRKMSAKLCDSKASLKLLKTKGSDSSRQGDEIKLETSTVIKQEEIPGVKENRGDRKKSGTRSSLEHEQNLSMTKRTPKSEKQVVEKSSKNFEQKYEMFKQKWRAEKERRRLLKDKFVGESSTAVFSTEDTQGSSEMSSLNPPVEAKSTLTNLQEEASSIRQVVQDKLLKVQIGNVNVVEESPTTPITKTAPAKRGWPKGKPRSKKQTDDDSRTPDVKDTISIASMILGDRASLKKHVCSPSSKTGRTVSSPASQYKDKWKPKPEISLHDNHYKSYFNSNTNQAPSLTQIAAMKIQKKAHQQKQHHLQTNLIEASFDNAKNEIDLTGITLTSVSPVRNRDKISSMKRKSLDFITGRLKYKKKMEELKAQQEANVNNPALMPDVLKSRDLNPQSCGQPSLPAKLISPMVSRYATSQQTSPPPTCHINQPITLRHPTWTCFPNNGRMFSVSPAPTVSSSKDYPQQPAGAMIISPGMLLGTSKSPSNVTSIAPQRKEPIPIMPKSSTSTSLNLPSPDIKEEPFSPNLNNQISAPAHQPRKRKNTDGDPVQIDDKRLKTELRRTRRDSEKHLKTSKSDGGSPATEYKCTLPGCNKSFRKQHLLDYHLKYFHTAKSAIRRNRSSISVSSTDSNTNSALPSPVPMETSKNASNVSLTKLEESNCSSNASHEVDVVETSDSEESESENETATVDECVKCVCEDECELGFMIQCEQCFTWQHGECVGYNTQKNVPLFYLCHVCSNPKGLRPSCRYNNDYTWQRFGRVPPVNDALNESKITDPVLKEHMASIQHVDKDDEEILSSIMVASHGMVSDLCNIKDVLQHVRQKYVMFWNSSLKEEDGKLEENKELDGEALEDLLLEIEKKSKQSDQEKEVQTKIKDEPIDDEDQDDVSRNVNESKAPLKDKIEEIEPATDISTSNKENDVDEMSTTVLEKEANDKSNDSNNVKSIIDVNRLVERGGDQTLNDESDNNQIVNQTDDAAILSFQSNKDNNVKSNQSDAISIATDQSDVSKTGSSDQSAATFEPCDNMQSDLPGDLSKSQSKSNIQCNTSTVDIDESENVTVEKNQSDTSVIKSSQLDDEKNDQSEAETETADEQTEMDISDEKPRSSDKLKTEEVEGFNETKPYSMLEDLPKLPIEKLTRKNIVATYELFVEIERIENEVESRLDDLEKYLDVLEKEYDSIDRSKEVVKQFKEKFQLPDIKSLSKFLHRIKWTSIMNEAKV